MPSVYIVCWIVLLTLQTYFCIQANSVDPDQTAPEQSDLGPHCLQKCLLKSQADDKADNYCKGLNPQQESVWLIFLLPSQKFDVLVTFVIIWWQGWNNKEWIIIFVDFIDV